VFPRRCNRQAWPRPSTSPADAAPDPEFAKLDWRRQSSEAPTSTRIPRGAAGPARGVDARFGSGSRPPAANQRRSAPMGTAVRPCGSTARVHVQRRPRAPPTCLSACRARISAWVWPAAGGSPPDHPAASDDHGADHRVRPRAAASPFGSASARRMNATSPAVNCFSRRPRDLPPGS